MFCSIRGDVMSEVTKTDKPNKAKEPPRHDTENDQVEEAGKESFPASDSPAWYSGKDTIKKNKK